MKITEIIPQRAEEPRITRLAAYCRVSSDSKDQLHSFAAQIRYYKDYERKRPEYRLVDIYADEGITGTSMEKRDELNRMIRDCKKGKIDRIVCKSVSRFARNTEELLATLRMLKDNGVSVYFEEQGIDTEKLNSEMIVTFPGMAAQEESVKISEYMRWSYQKRMQSGEFNCCYPAFGFILKNGNMEVNEPEAEVVRLIFSLYLQGHGTPAIAKMLNDQGIPHRKGSQRWRSTTIRYIIGNERYMGDALLQKRFTTDTLPFKEKRNRGELPQYYVHNSNPAIISREVYMAAQRLIEARARQGRRKRTQYSLTKMLRCPECGRSFRRQELNGTVYWQCEGRAAGETNCRSRRLKEDAVYEAFTELTWKLTMHRTELLGTLVRQLTLMQNRSSQSAERIRAIDKRIADITAQNLVVTRLHTKGIVGIAEYTAQTDDLNAQLRDLRGERRKLLAEDETDELLDILRNLDELISDYEPGADFDEELFGEIVQSITVDDHTHITFKLLGGIELTEEIHERGRCRCA